MPPCVIILPASGTRIMMRNVNRKRMNSVPPIAPTMLSVPWKKLKATLCEEEQQRRTLSEEEREEVRALGEQFAEVWDSASSPATLKKRIIRTVIEEAIVDLDDGEKTLSFTIRWKGGSHTRFQIPKPASSAA